MKKVIGLLTLLISIVIGHAEERTDGYFVAHMMETDA